MNVTQITIEFSDLVVCNLIYL